MAIFYPEYEKILALTPKSEEGELHLLSFLKKELDDSFEVYFHPLLNGDRPDVILIRENYGILIIEVKDWRFSNYYLDSKHHWYFKNSHLYAGNNIRILDPIDQVIQYKKNIYNLHIENLLEKKIKNFSYWRIVQCAIYFHNENKDSINKFLVEPYRSDPRYLKRLKYDIEFIGRDNLQQDDFNKLLSKKYMLRTSSSKYFENDLYKNFKKFLQPPDHYRNEGIHINYSKRQKELVVSNPHERRVKGVVGSGKTTVLAKRAVNAHLRTGERVLILCYNITLSNYIKDRINDVSENFSWSSFYVNNYHDFIKSEMNNCGIGFHFPHDFDTWPSEQKSIYFESKYFGNTNLFKGYEHKLHKYKTILIDEIQDFKRPWMDIIKKYFLEPGGEYVLYGDEKQNIYNTEIKNKDLVTNVIGRPSELKDSFRSYKKIKDIAIGFQHHCFKLKYEIDDFNSELFKHKSADVSSFASYLFSDKKTSLLEIYNFIHESSIILEEHPNDISILSTSIGMLRDLDAYYRYKTNERTNTMFESQEIWFSLLMKKVGENSLFSKRGEFIHIPKSRTSDLDSRLSKLVIIKHLANITCDPQMKSLYQRYSEIVCTDKNLFERWFEEGPKRLLDNNGRSSLKSLEKNIDAKYISYFIRDIEDIRKNKKTNFWYNSGTIKLSTIHSFKGWEANTIFLIVDEWGGKDTNDSFEELLYTGITRCIKNLIIINCGNIKYHNLLHKLVEGTYV